MAKVEANSFWFAIELHETPDKSERVHNEVSLLLRFGLLHLLSKLFDSSEAKFSTIVYSK